MWTMGEKLWNFHQIFWYLKIIAKKIKVLGKIYCKFETRTLERYCDVEKREQKKWSVDSKLTQTFWFAFKSKNKNYACDLRIFLFFKVFPRPLIAYRPIVWGIINTIWQNLKLCALGTKHITVLCITINI